MFTCLLERKKSSSSQKKKYVAKKDYQKNDEKNNKTCHVCARSMGRNNASLGPQTLISDTSDDIYYRLKCFVA